MAPRYEICVGLEKGHKTTKVESARDKNRIFISQILFVEQLEAQALQDQGKVDQAQQGKIAICRLRMIPNLNVLPFSL